MVIIANVVYLATACMPNLASENTACTKKAIKQAMIQYLQPLIKSSFARFMAALRSNMTKRRSETEE